MAEAGEKTLFDVEATLMDAGTWEAGALKPQGVGADIDSGSATLVCGEAVGNLQVLTPLGEGSMGATYIARHPVLRTAFAVKTFKSSRDDVFKEAYLAARIDSRHVVPITDAGHLRRGDFRIPYLVQGYVDGLDLRDVIGAVRGLGRTVPAGFAARLVAEVALGLQACHKAGVVHCDVKPSNIMLHGSGSAMLGDFGIAQAPQHRPDDGFVVTGSPAYIPPELWREGGLTSGRSDIYALGVTAHQLMTGTLPILGRNLNEWKAAHLGHTYMPPPPRSPREAYLFSVISRMLEKHPEERPETAEMVATLLDPMIDGLPKFVGRTGESVAVGPLRIDVVVGNMMRANADVAAWSVSPDGESDPDAEVRTPSRLGDVSWPDNPTPGERQTALVAAAMDGTVCIQRVLLRLLFGAEARRCGRVALQPLGTRTGQLPMELAAKMMLETIRTFAALRPHYVRHIQIMLDSSLDIEAWRSTMDYFGGRSHHGYLQRWEQ